MGTSLLHRSNPWGTDVCNPPWHSHRRRRPLCVLLFLSVLLLAKEDTSLQYQVRKIQAMIYQACVFQELSPL